MKVARLTLSDRASAGIYEDRSGPEIERVFGEADFGEVEWRRVVMPDERPSLSPCCASFAMRRIST
jgi:molybdopterin adenylyltransferase